ncbi:MAG: HAD-IC family P-type ATPase [Gammaproteobacteria bacterium]|nr:HAD-IC family P-type ATPase [Gammaproteobacteria bacterium]
MSKTFHFSLPGITCVNCVIPVEHVLSKCETLNITEYATDLVTKTISITVEDDLTPNAEIIGILTETIEDIGVECIAIPPPDLAVMEAVDEINEPVPEVIQPPKKSKIRSHIIKGIVGVFLGASVIALTLSGIVLPTLLMYAMVASSSLLTFLLGAEFYFDAAKKLVKARTLTMDTLFTVSTLTVIGVSIASLFVPWLPMMLETGLLIFGFRHLGKALEESIIQKVAAELAFKDRAAVSVLKKEKQNEMIIWNECPSSALLPGQIIRLKAGDVIPVDGICESENSSLYTTIVTGAIVPSAIQQGEIILAGMKVPDDVDYIEIRITQPAAQSYLAKLDQKILQANKEKARIETTTNKILQFFVPAILALAVISGVAIGLFFTPALAIQCAASILVSACPCTLGFITPLAVKIGVSKALENGVQFKNSKTLQNADDIDTVVFDLNGTLTTGIPEVTDYQIYPGNQTDPEDFFRDLALIERESLHPVAKTIYAFSIKKTRFQGGIAIDHIDQTQHAGIKAVIDGAECLVGNIDFLRAHDIDMSQADYEINHAEQIIFLVKNKKIMGHVKIKDPLREDAKLAVNELKKMGKAVYICTGADVEVANQYARELGIAAQNVQANCLNASDNPNDLTKPHFIAALQAENKRVAMIGDAANDALAIIKSDFGMAVKSSSGDVITQEQAGAVIDNASLLPVVTAFAVAKQTVSSIKQNLVMSLVYNMTVLLAAGGALLAVGFSLNPAIGVALMVIQSALVLANQYRIKQKPFLHLIQYEKEQQHKPQPSIMTYGHFKKNGLMINPDKPSASFSLQPEVSPSSSPSRRSWDGLSVQPQPGSVVTNNKYDGEEKQHSLSC